MRPGCKLIDVATFLKDSSMSAEKRPGEGAGEGGQGQRPWEEPNLPMP